MLVEKSKGHKEFIANYEYFVRNGELYRVPVHLPVMPDGYRSGRWQCSESMIDSWMEMIKEGVQ